MERDRRNWLYSKREGDGLPWKTEPEARGEESPKPPEPRGERGPAARRRWV